jgi:dipeptidyl aminopeptidase/acylaminoacyl peptidase
MTVKVPGACVALLCGICLAGEVVAAGKRIDVEDVANIVRFYDPQLAPDGKSIAYVVSRPNARDARYDRALVLVDVATGRQRQLTYDRRGISNPRWSPSGDRLAFLDSAPAEPEQGQPELASAANAALGRVPKYQVFVMPMSGGEAHRVTYAAEDVEQFAWSPDGTRIAYVVADENPRRKDIEKHNDAFEVGDNDYLATEQLMPSHVWLVSADGGRARRLTSGAWSLPKGAPPSSPASPLSWSPDGQSILIVQQATPNWGDSDQVTVATLNVASGEVRKLTTHKAFEGYPVYSPDGRWISYGYSRDGDPNNESEVFLTDSAGGDGRDLTWRLDRNVVRAVWTPDSQSLILAAHDGARVQLWLQPRNGGAMRIDLGDLDPAWGFWVDLSVAKEGGVAFTASTPTHPNEIYYLPPRGGLRRLTGFNQEIAGRALGRSEEFKWQGPDGTAEDGVLVYPPDFKVGQKYPLVLVIHGGPQSASTMGFAALPQLLAAHGYVVFSPNYRGSDNLGNAYQRAIVNDAGEGPGQDVMAGIEALEQLGFIDPTRIAVSGWSYGGYMTSWLTSHYHIWKAAVAGAAVNDFIHAYALTDFNVTTRYIFGGPPWSPPLLQAYRDQSPITYASQITTPTLIMSDTGDARVPITQSYLMYHALKDHGVTVQFIAYPVPGHFPSDPVRTSDVYRRWVDWIDRYLR